jgi:2-polyprenyl-6-methoxyphenol hydroxylase-like FAD-dependent oxidoreductase
MHNIYLQGCNVAMQDAAVLADLLSENLSDIDSALFKFSERRVPEGHALLDLSVTASTPKVGERVCTCQSVRCGNRENGRTLETFGIMSK